MTRFLFGIGCGLEAAALTACATEDVERIITVGLFATVVVWLVLGVAQAVGRKKS